MKFLALSLLVSLVACSGYTDRSPNSVQIPADTLARLKKLYPDQSEAFIIERFQNADSPLLKWRSFPPYYYELYDRVIGGNQKNKKFTSSRGLCAGDAHLENFGFLYLPEKKSTLFGLNDLDDVSECSLFSDTLRLYVGHKIVDPSLSVSVWHAAYTDGLKGAKHALPESLKKLEKKSLKNGTELSKKNKKLFEEKVCEGEYSKLSVKEKQVLDSYLQGLGHKYVFACMRTKDSGGSAGLSRFVFQSVDGRGNLETLELKPLAQPSPIYNRAAPMRVSWLQSGIESFWGMEYRAHYFPVILNGVSYLRRPLWNGNEGVALDDLDSASIPEVSYYEAYTLGKLHAKSRNNLSALKISDLENSGQLIEKQWRLEMNE